MVKSENKEEGEGGGNERTCLMDSIVSVAPEGVDKTKLKKDIGQSMPVQGDTSMPFIMRHTPIADVLEVLSPPTNFWSLGLHRNGS